MGRSRGPFDIHPAPVAELAERYQMPVILVDWQITRRQRCHAVHFPDGRPTYTDTNLLRALRECDMPDHTHAVLVHTDLQGNSEACYIRLEPLSPQESENG